jgi:Xaa-Pro aminopeptidase
MEFSHAEMTRRLEAIRAGMDAAGVDCLLVTGVENFSYFVGVPSSLYQTRRPWCALIPLAGEPVAVMKEGAPAATLERNGFFRSIEPYPLPVSEHLPSIVVGVIRRFGARRVAVELGQEMRLGLPLLDYRAITDALPDVEFVDGAALIWSLRMIKSAEEIERMRRACEITATTRQAVFREVRPGMTEAEVAELWAELMHRAGAERPSFIYVNSGGAVDLLPSPTKRLAPGQTLWLDGGAYVGGYTCDFSRVATLGPPSPRQLQLHQDAVEVQQLLIDQVRPGVPVADLARLCFSEIAARGYPERDTAGHGMGMLINEPPLITPSHPGVLEVGLTLGIEQGQATSDGMFVWEDLVQVTADGHDVLTNESSELVVLDV